MVKVKQADEPAKVKKEQLMPLGKKEKKKTAANAAGAAELFMRPV